MEVNAVSQSNSASSSTAIANNDTRWIPTISSVNSHNSTL